MQQFEASRLLDGGQDDIDHADEREHNPAKQRRVGVRVVNPHLVAPDGRIAAEQNPLRIVNIQDAESAGGQQKRQTAEHESKRRMGEVVAEPVSQKHAEGVEQRHHAKGENMADEHHAEVIAHENHDQEVEHTADEEVKPEAEKLFGQLHLVRPPPGVGVEEAHHADAQRKRRAEKVGRLRHEKRNDAVVGKRLFEAKREEAEVGVEQKDHVENVVAHRHLIPDFRYGERGENLVERHGDHSHQHEARRRLEQGQVRRHGNRDHDERQQHQADEQALTHGIDAQFGIDRRRQVAVEEQNGQVAEADKKDIRMELEQECVAGQHPETTSKGRK